MDISRRSVHSEPSAERVKEIMKVTREVIRGLTASEKGDNGIVRRKVAEIMYRRDSSLSPKEREKVVRFARKRLVREFDFGSKNIPACIDALHSARPEDSEIAHIIGREFNVLSTGKILETIKEIRHAVDELYRKNPNTTGKKALRKISTKFNDKVSARIIGLMRLHEEGTKEIAKEAARKSGAAFIQACSRLKQDWNRPDDTRKISNTSGEASEYSFESHIVEHELMRDFMVYKKVLKDGRLTAPFLQVSVHGCAKHRGGSDIFIANGVKNNGELPCSPAIAKWFKDKLDSYIRSLSVNGYDGDKLRTHIAVEGQRLSGSTASVRRRWGLKGVTAGWGEMFQYIQLELSPYIRKVGRKEITDVLARVIHDFHVQFGSRTALKLYVDKNSSYIDKAREDGSLYFNKLPTSKRVKNGTIQMNSDCRKMLGVATNDAVLVQSLTKKGDPDILRLMVNSAYYKNKTKVRPRVSSDSKLGDNVLISVPKVTRSKNGR